MKTLSIHVTDLCNSTCSFCVVGSPFYAKDTISYDDICTFLNDNHGADFDTVNLHGGEATIHPRFFDILKLIKELGYREVHLQTNALRCADPAFAARVCEMGVNKAIVSLHGDTPDMQDSQTGTRGGFERTIQGIANLKSCGAALRTNTVITRQNLSHLKGICELACQLGVDHINLSNMHPVGSAFLSRTMSMPQFHEMLPHLNEAVELVKARGRVITLEGFPYCTVGLHSAHQLNNEDRQIRMLMRGQVIDNYDSFMSDTMRMFGEPCRGCSQRSFCGGVYPQYIDFFGWGEFRTIPESNIVSPDQKVAVA